MMNKRTLPLLTTLALLASCGSSCTGIPGKDLKPQVDELVNYVPALIDFYRINSPEAETESMKELWAQRKENLQHMKDIVDQDANPVNQVESMPK